MACGRRWGKTATGILAALRGHGEHRGQLKGAIDGGRIWWVAPSYPSLVASNAWSDLKRACRDAAASVSEMDKTIVLPGGGSITVRSASDPDSLRGPGLDGVVIDEAAFLSEDAWTDALRPALTDREGWAMMISTPNGRNWFWQRYDAAEALGDWERWQQPSRINPVLRDAELARALAAMGPRKFAQEHLANFVDIEGAAFPSEYFESHIWAEDWPESFEASAIYIDPSMGATEHSDYSAIVFVGVTGGLLYVDADIKRRPPMQIVADGCRMFHEYNPTLFGTESNGFQAVLAPLFDAYCRENGYAPLPVSLVNNHEKKKVRIWRLDPHFANRNIRMHPTRPDCRELVEQLMFFPDKGYHDDGPDALEGAIRLIRHLENIAAEDTQEELVTA